MLRFIACALAAWASTAALASGEFYETHFNSLSDLDRWQITGATNWQVAKGNLVDPGLGGRQILTVARYDPSGSDTIERYAGRGSCVDRRQ